MKLCHSCCKLNLFKIEVGTELSLVREKECDNNNYHLFD